MKTISAKDFQIRQSQVMKEVARGATYLVTFHGKAWVELSPGIPDHKKPIAGSPEAFRESLQISLSSKSLPAAPDYKKLRNRHIKDKYQ